ncbi:luciferin 4-monooxygenase-like isoform X4 [Haemaphysalis longicornis]
MPELENVKEGRFSLIKKDGGSFVKVDKGVVTSYFPGVSVPDVDFATFFKDVFARHEDKTALVDATTGERCTFGELRDAAYRVAVGLQRLGLCPADVVAFHCANGNDFLVILFGTFFAGGTATLTKMNLNERYGMTELTACITYSTPRPDNFKSVGSPVVFTEMKVVDVDTGKVLGPLEQGEIYVKGPSAFRGYLRRPQETADIYEDGFVRTGDKGFYSPDGCFFVSGRLKELIKCMDQQVAPAELEELLATDPAVRQVVVAGVPHPEFGEAARAFVVLENYHRPTGPNAEALEECLAARLRDLVVDKLSFHKHLHGGVEFVDSIPQTSSGKDMRRELKQSYIERYGQALK